MRYTTVSLLPRSRTRSSDGSDRRASRRVGYYSIRPAGGTRPVRRARLGRHPLPFGAAVARIRVSWIPGRCGGMRMVKRIAAVVILVVLGGTVSVSADRTVKPVLHGKNWVAITGKPL